MSLIITFMFEPAKLQMNCARASGTSTRRSAPAGFPATTPSAMSPGVVEHEPSLSAGCGATCAEFSLLSHGPADIITVNPTTPVQDACRSSARLVSRGPVVAHERVEEQVVRAALRRLTTTQSRPTGKRHRPPRAGARGNRPVATLRRDAEPQKVLPVRAPADPPRYREIGDRDEHVGDHDEQRGRPGKGNARVSRTNSVMLQLP